MRPFSLDSERFDYIFQLAIDEDVKAPALEQLSSAELEEYEALRNVLSIIDASWQATDEEKDTVRSLFLQKLAADDPNHPWVLDKLVHTLGELVRVNQDEVPTLPVDSYIQILKDETTIETLLDPKHRTAALGQALR